ncbi:tetratricopeptide repeat protein [Streptomyces justiciae]|uniref:Tetratricopeptide repeat protein n=1 Tax=Streptomyces justiciae TaxID=2780140 RepID=A0ABU3M8P9_9ACTN|nr:tetratricopeptide repeat protein [Streptomyces justiciae]MDT7847890.1 tetratricopeptide repeat protein [Streptomyces justiciae]
MSLAGALLASQWLQAGWAAPVGGAIGALFAVIAGWAKQWLDRQWDLRRELPRNIVLHNLAGGFPRVRDITDPVALGVHRAVNSADTMHGSYTDELPPYVPREIDSPLREAIRQGGLIVVVGESAAGKSRAAFESVRTQAADHVLAAPSSREVLSDVVTSLSDTPRAVLWLDDLERFLGPGGLTPAMVTGLTKSGRKEVLLLGTMRIAEYERFTSRAATTAADPDHLVWRESREVLRAARIVPLNRLWSPTELAEAERFGDDPRIARALNQAGAFGIAEILTAGPVLVRDWYAAWTTGTHPRGAALVAAAVDCRRAGLDKPISGELLEDLHTHYLDAHGGHALRPEPMEAAWAWALQPVHGASSLLIPSGPTGQEPHFLAFDYLIDQPALEPVPTETWNRLLAHADASRVALAAYWRVRTAFHAAIDSGAVDNVFMRASALADHRSYDEAIRLLTETLEELDGQRLPHNEWRASLRHNIAFYQLRAGRIDHAEAAFQELLADAELVDPPDAEGLNVIRHNLASCARQRGDLPGALAQFQRVLSDRQRNLGPHAMNTLATRSTIADIIGKMGDPAQALRLTRQVLADEQRALGEDHTNTLQTRHSLANWLAETGDLAGAVEELLALVPALARALGPEHPTVLDARWDLGRYQGRHGSSAAAIRQFQEVLTVWHRLRGEHDPQVVRARRELEDFRTRHSHQ